MASGRLARALIAQAGSNTLIYTVPSGYYSTLNVSFVNNTGLAVPIRLAITTQSNNNPLPSEYIEYNVNIPGVNGVLERTAIVCSSGEKIVVWAGNANAITVRVNGYEESLI